MTSTDLSKPDTVEEIEADKIIVHNIKPREKENIFDVVQTDILTFSQPLLPNLWDKIQLYVQAIAKRHEKGPTDEPVQFKLLGFHTMRDTRCQAIDFYAVKPQLFLEAIMLWLIHNTDKDHNTIVSVVCHSTIICSTASLRQQIAIAQASREMAIASNAEDKAAGLTLGQAIDKFDNALLAFEASIEQVNPNIGETVETEPNVA